jgi:hypothetical protein
MGVRFMLWIVAMCLSEIESRRLGTSMNAALISESSSSSVQVGMGFPSQYYCSGRVFDEPRRYENVEKTHFIHFFQLLNVTHIQSSVKVYQEL